MSTEGLIPTSAEEWARRTPAERTKHYMNATPLRPDMFDTMDQLDSPGVIELDRVGKQFGKVVALRDGSLSVRPSMRIRGRAEHRAVRRRRGLRFGLRGPRSGLAAVALG